MKLDDVLVLDGGLSNALEDRGLDLSSDLWTARLLLDDPAQIAAVHRDYYLAGADVATTASYQASVPSLVAAGLTKREAEHTIVSSVLLACGVRDEIASHTGRRLLVAASVGPYGAVLADGSEYRGRYGVSPAALRDFHGPRLELLASAGPDLLAVETIPDADEAEVLVPLLDELGLPAWFSYSVSGDSTRAGQPLRDAYAVLADSTSIVAAGVNCSAPYDVMQAVTAAVAVTGRPAVAYPNLGETWDSESHTWSGDGVFNTALAADWVAAGARLVGGCCRVGPDHIAQLAGVLKEHEADRDVGGATDVPIGG
ncbi:MULTISPECIES: homocysteine S-methyltransferase [Nocardioides]|uniref:homocysteine S-methyltransferase n=1 Tax=Nocardioides TaxID=1839 RepID=UPI00032DE21C|nr:MULTISPECIES: homocysteine S-methyltransferase [Nocardioides]EON22901.1 homocysteine S-methyltransferase [Nocardioides sp. CF8]